MKMGHGWCGLDGQGLRMAMCCRLGCGGTIMVTGTVGLMPVLEKELEGTNA